ncbi:MAG TPA: response regulator [Rhizomicrobium sp.]|jgi:CheY-like chemotaxis protein
MASVAEVALPDLAERRPTVLLVDDEFLIRLALSDFLQECGFKTLEATDAERAIAALETLETPIDVVLTDVRMPGEINGFGLAQWIRQNRPSLPVLLVSGDAQKADIAEQLCEKQDIMPKPLDFHLIAKRLRAAIETNKNGD